MTERSAPAVHVESASLSYEGRHLFDDLSLSLPAGRTTCLLGPSGVGKTSLLRLVAGLSASASGSVADEEGRALRGRVSYMAQQDLLLPWLTTRDNLVLGFRLRDRVGTGERVRAGDMLEAVGLTEAAGLRPAALSAGMRQRAALARTLLEDRPVVLMDEPFSALDAITRYQLQGLAARLLAGRTVLLITHDPLEALRLGHRIHVMSGRPARLDEALEPEGAPPREAHDEAVRRLEAELLERLAMGSEA